MTKRLPHGVPGQVNIYVLDKDSDITGHGAHNRILVFGHKDGTITAREDVRGLPFSTEEQRRKVLNGWQRQHPRNSRLKLIHQEYGGDSIEHIYRAEGGVA
ncbi:hypothetical protein [Variovorax sp. 278MFTsu5.1]|uniref:hypothetical protein n=1 Tax=Variovorax sp. 278MFTsu5.1 TaxID=3158366 RepID=UPI003AADD2A2